MSAVVTKARQKTATRKVDLKIWIRATPERVFKALTDAKELDRWFLANAATEPRLGGKFRISWSKRGDYIDSKFVAFVPGKKVSFSWSRGELVTFYSSAHEGWHARHAAPRGFRR